MEKRTVLAIVLSIVIIAAFQYLMPKSRPPAPPGEEAAQQAQGTGDAVPSAAKEESPAERPQAEGVTTPGGQSLEPVKEIVVNTELYQLTLSNKGAVITGWTLHDYKDDSGNPVQLVSEASRTKGRYPLSLLFDDDEMTRRANGSVYSASADSITLEGEGAEKTLVLTCREANGARITKELRFSNANYYIDVTVKQKNLTDHTIPGKYYLTWGYNLGRNLGQSNKYHYTGPSTWVGEELVNDDPDDFEKTVIHKGRVSWSALQSMYFAGIIVSHAGEEAEVLIRKDDKNLQIGMASREALLKPHAEVASAFGVYGGPKKMESLAALDRNLDKIIDYGWFTVLAKPLMQALNWFHDFTGNYGWDIIILTVLIKIIFYPITTSGFKSMRKMQKLQPKMTALRKKYKSDPQKLNQEIMDLYKKHKVNPLGGCMPMILQIPVFFALYKALLISIELRQAPFMFWLVDLSAKDPYYITPILMGVSMFVQQKMTPSTGDPTQAKVMLLMPVVFTFLFLSFPSGLVLYWLLNNILGIGQQYLINKQEDGKEAAA